MESASEPSAESRPSLSAGRQKATSSEPPATVWWALFSLVLGWAFLLKHLSVVWRVSPHYQYGWLVPGLTLLFLASRWRAALRMASDTESARRGARPAALACALLLLPVWWVRVATPDWSPIGYILALLVTGWTFFFLASCGGWNFAAQLGFPVFFIFCAVPWPQRAETWITLALGKMVAGSTVELLQWSGIAAERLGNIVALPGGMIEVSEACSGVRSLQSMLMAGLCLGEVRRLSFPRRIFLVVIGLVLALILNVVRNFSLALVANDRGPSAIEAWHDPAGWSITLLSFGLLLLISRWMISRRDFPKAESVATPTPPCTLRWFAAAGFAGWFAAIFVGTELWYRAHEHDITPQPALVTQWPLGASGFRWEEIPDTARNLLMASNVQAASWEETPGHRWTLTSARWAPGENAPQSARMHFPEVCFPASGAQLVASGRDVPLPVGDHPLPFRLSEFQLRGRKIFIFFCLREESARDQARNDLSQEWSPWGRIQRAWAGYRNLGQQTAALAITGASDTDDAIRQAGLRLPALLALQPAASK